MNFFKSTLHKTTSKRRKAQTLSSLIIFIPETPEKLSLVTLVFNYHKSSLLPFVIRPGRKFEKPKPV